MVDTKSRGYSYSGQLSECGYSRLFLAPVPALVHIFHMLFLHGVNENVNRGTIEDDFGSFKFIRIIKFFFIKPYYLWFLELSLIILDYVSLLKQIRCYVCGIDVYKRLCTLPGNLARIKLKTCSIYLKVTFHIGCDRLFH